MRVNEDRRKIVHTVKRGKATWICYILRRNCLQKHFMEGKIEVMDDEEEDVGRYWMNVTKREGTVSRQRKH